MSTGRLEPEISKKSAVLGATQQDRHTVQIRVGFFAGSFDPIHDGHVAVANSAILDLELDQLYFMVEEMPWGDKSPASLDNRCQMVDLAIENHEKMQQLKIKDKQFSISNTLLEIEQKFAGSELYFIFGADVFMHMNSIQWPGLEKLLEHYLVVFERGNIREHQISDHAVELGVAIAVLPSEHLHHSSSDVRLKPHEKSIWVTEKVSNYIKINNIY